MTEPRRRHRAPATVYLLAGGVYLVLAVVLWWHAWSTQPSGVMTCGCTDAGREVWYLEWAAYALAHGHHPWYSQWLFYPHGVNLLSDTSIPLLGALLSPVTLAFGPVLSMNVLSTLTPALAALSMFWLLRRWVAWSPAAFFGGLCFGFLPFVVTQLAFGWVNIAFGALVPLMVGCLDELVVRQRRSPVALGLALAALFLAQFLISNEMLLIEMAAIAVGLALLAGYAVVHDRSVLTQRWRRLAVGLGTAAGGTVALLAYPVWFFLEGPAHLSGLVWTSAVPGNLGNVPSDFWSTTGPFGPLGARALAAQARIFGGYLGPPLPPPAYLGLGLLAVVVLGALVWRRDRLLWFFTALGAISALVSLRSVDGDWGPWALVQHVSVVENVWQGRFSVVVNLSAAVLLAVIVARAREALVTRAPWSKSRSGVFIRAVAVAGAVAVGTAALAPVAAALAPNVPMTMQGLVVPRWFQEVGPGLAPGQVVLPYPMATAETQTALVWQAFDRLSFAMPGGGGPAGTPSRAGRDRRGFALLEQASVDLGPPPALSRPNLKAVRQAIADWRVTMVVVPGQAGLPRYARGRSDAFAVAFFTAVLGRPPHQEAGAEVWAGAPGSTAPLVQER